MVIEEIVLVLKKHALKYLVFRGKGVQLLSLQMIQKKKKNREGERESMPKQEAEVQSSLGEFFILTFQLFWVYFKLHQNYKLPKK